MPFNPHLEIGQIISNEDIHEIFKVDKQQGIRTSKNHDYIVIISKHMNGNYEDEWVDNYTINYTGSGQLGDQSITGRNKTLANANIDNKELFFFEVEVDKEYIYRGKCDLIGEPFYASQIDKDNTERRVVQFPLRLHNERRDFFRYKEIEIAELKEEEEFKKSFEHLTFHHRSNKDKFHYHLKPKKKKEPAIKDGVKVYIRDAKTSSNALELADYKCEFDKGHFSFIRKNIDVLYTEPHHLIPMQFSDKFDVSLDVEENIISLCSHCHNLVHYGKDRFIVLEKLYNERKELLKEVGIEINFEELKQMYK